MKKKFNNQKHGFHLVDPSPWPIFTSFSVLVMVVGFVIYLHSSNKGEYDFGSMMFVYGLVLTSLTVSCWWRDIIREATFEGQHTLIVQRGLKIGMILFILSEVMFFFCFFLGVFSFEF